MIPKETIEFVKAYLEENNKNSGALLSGLVFGNAFTGEEIFIGAGEARRGRKLTKFDYWRWASTTKIIGLTALGAAIEDGIITNLQDPVSKYIPEFSNINQYVSDVIPLGGFDKYGLPRYKMVLTTIPGLGDRIKIIDLVRNTSGLGYFYYGVASALDFVRAEKDTEAGKRYIALLQFFYRQIDIGKGNVDNLLDYYYNVQTDITHTILERTRYPLLCVPGIRGPGTSPPIYAFDYDILGGIIGQALKAKGINMTGAQYVQKRLFKPLGMNNSWLGLSSLPVPEDAKTKLVQSTFVRKNNIDGQAGPLVKFNRVYGTFDFQARGDGFTRQANNIALYPFQRSNYLAGALAAFGFGPITDFVNILKLLIQNGKFNGKRILSEKTVRFILSPKNPPGTPLTIFGEGTLNYLLPYNVWSGGMTKVDLSLGVEPPFPLGPNTYSWGGYFGTTYYFDTDTGYYLYSGTQANGEFYNAWQVPSATAKYQPDALFLYATLVEASENCK